LCLASAKLDVTGASHTAKPNRIYVWLVPYLALLGLGSVPSLIKHDAG